MLAEEPDVRKALVRFREGLGGNLRGAPSLLDYRLGLAKLARPARGGAGSTKKGYSNACAVHPVISQARRKLACALQGASSGQTTFDDEPAGWLSPCSRHLQAGLARELTELRERAALASQQNHLYRHAPGRTVRRYPAKDHDSSGRTGCFARTAQNRRRLTVGPVVYYLT